MVVRARWGPLGGLAQGFGTPGTRLYARMAVQRRRYEVARGWLAWITLPLRALDTPHLAVAAAEGLRRATADQELSRSARNLGVAVTLVRA